MATPNQRKDDDHWLAAWVLLLLLLGARAINGLTPAQQLRARTLLRDKFNNDAVRLAAAITSGAITLDEWQAGMRLASGDYARQMAVAGAGTLPNVDVQESVNTALQGQEPFLAGFSEAIGAGDLSAPQIAARSKLYGGVGWAAIWIAAASVQPDFTIVHYVARDDDRTCVPCMDAERGSPYRADSNYPTPGSVCLGGGYCRCELHFVVDRAIWESL
jgi:hypothetical protein